MTVIITFTSIGTDAGPFNLYSNVDGYSSAFELGITRTQLLTGFPSYSVPLGTTIIRAKSFGVCTNFVDLSVVLAPTTTTTSTTIAPTTTSTTTIAAPIAYYLTASYATGSGSPIVVKLNGVTDLSVNVSGSTYGSPVTLGDTIEAIVDGGGSQKRRLRVSSNIRGVLFYGEREIGESTSLVHSVSIIPNEFITILGSYDVII